MTTLPANPLETWTTERGESPWRDFTGSYEEEEAGRHVAAVAFEGAAAKGEGGRPLIAIDQAARRVVVNRDAFGDLTRVDATRLGAGERRAIGTVHDAALLADPRALVRFLVRSQVVQTFVHVGATVQLVRETDDGTHYRAELEAVHTYYTHARHDVRYAFVLGVDRLVLGSGGAPSGVMFVLRS